MDGFILSYFYKFEQRIPVVCQLTFGGEVV